MLKKQLHKLFLLLAEKCQPSAKEWQLDTDHTVTPSVYADGVQYYQLQDLMNGYCRRTLSALDIFEKWNMRCSREHLIEFVGKCESIFKKQSIGLNEIIEFRQVINDLKERLLLPIPSSELIYELASVAFFDENENPYSYDEQYNKKKIEKWKQSKSIEDFFLSMPFKNIVSLPDLSNIDLKDYFQTLEKIDQIHKERLSVV